MLKQNHHLSMNLIVASDNKNGIGKNGSLPWNLPEDLSHFQKMTKNGIVIMGRKTWDSIPEQHRPLKDRINLILSRTNNARTNNVFWFSNYDLLLDFLKKMSNTRPIFIIGGSSIYQYFLNQGFISKIYLTKVFRDFECDTFFPDINCHRYFSLTRCGEKKNHQDLEYQFREYSLYQPIKKNIPSTLYGEYQYLDLIDRVLQDGEKKGDRTGIGTISLFGETLEFNIRDSFPLLTTKKMFTRGIIAELLWFLNGKTDNELLRNQKVHIWDGNSSREFLDNNNLNHLREWDCGPIYGFNFRHFGAKYVDCDTDYSGQGVDQISEVIDLIRNNPESRRIIINLWNPSQLKEVALPACHVLYQFNVSGKNKEHLSCCMYQRSGDLGLGVPFNIASATLLTYLLAKITNKTPLYLKIFIADAHIYLNHVESLKEQLTRKPKPFPLMKISEFTDFTRLTTSDFSLQGYESHPSIKMEMAI